MQYIYHYNSLLGGITLAGEEKLTGLWFDGQKYFGSTLSETCVLRELPIFEQAKHWLDIYFTGRMPDFTPPLKIDATPFRRAVWEILLAVPFGETITYKEIAAQIAERRGQNSMSAQAVGGAVGHNPISLMIPCHRVVGSDGSLTGYAGGIDRKKKLLALERGQIKIYL